MDLKITKLINDSESFIIFKSGKYGYTYGGKVFVVTGKLSYYSVGTVKEYVSNRFKHSNLVGFNIEKITNDVPFCLMEEYIERGDFSGMNSTELSIGSVVRINKPINRFKVGLDTNLVVCSMGTFMATDGNEYAAVKGYFPYWSLEDYGGNEWTFNILVKDLRYIGRLL